MPFLSYEFFHLRVFYMVRSIDNQMISLGERDEIRKKIKDLSYQPPKSLNEYEARERKISALRDQLNYL